MVGREQLTTEYVKNFGLNNFEITNLAIQLMRSYIRSGHQISVEEVLELISKKGPEEVARELEEENVEEKDFEAHAG